MMKAYRRGESLRCNTKLWWFGSGSIPAWQIHTSALLDHLRYRGHHRASS